ncbi:hypothetical protein ABPG75_006359 [Micractinium tetrahymenae]
MPPLQPGPWQAGLMNFTDIQQQYLMKGIDPGVLRSGRSAVAAGGSCWAQAALAAVESRALKDGVDEGPNLSERQLLDCVNAGNGFLSRGCNGGLAEEAFEYISRQFAAAQPAYAAAPGAVDESFVFYDSGIYPASACRSVAGRRTYNHAVAIVGYSQAADPFPYFIIRNSWGDGWGLGGFANLGGYAKVQMTFDSVGACGMYRYPIVPLRTRKAGRPVPSPRPPPPRLPPRRPPPRLPAPRPAGLGRCVMPVLRDAVPVAQPGPGFFAHLFVELPSCRSLPASWKQALPQAQPLLPPAALPLAHLPRVHLVPALALQFTGSLLVPKAGRYVLHLSSTRRARLRLDGSLLMDQQAAQAEWKDQAVDLAVGWVPLRLDAFSYTEPLTVRLEWEGPGLAGDTIREGYLSPVVM